MRHHIGAMADLLTSTVLRALRKTPCSLRALAREAGIPHSTLVRILDGSRNASPDVAEALMSAFGRWSVACGEAASIISRVRSEA